MSVDLCFLVFRRRQKMDNAIVSSNKDGHKKENALQCTADDRESTKEDCWSKILVKEVKPEDVLHKSQISAFRIQKLFLQQISGLNKRIPKQVMILDETYLRHCLELIHISALSTASWNNIPSKMDVLSDHFSTRLVSTKSSSDAAFVVGCGTENGFISSMGDLILGTITGSTGMINILKSPLFQQLGFLDNDVNFEKGSLLDVRETVSSTVMSSSISSSQKGQNEGVILEDQDLGSGPVHKRLVSVISSTNSTVSDQSSSSDAYCQGMLHCSWSSGFPHFVFSIDDQREVYIANLLKVESPDDKVLDYMYMFYSRGGKKGIEIRSKESDLVGKMRVSTSLTLCPNNTEIMETQFVLCGASDNYIGEMQNSTHTPRKNKGLSKNVVKIFRPSHSHRHRNSSTFDGMSAIPEHSIDPCQDSSNESAIFLSKDNLPPNLELAAIIVKNHVRENHKVAGIGGWGLKFLREVGNRETSLNTGDCSTSMDVIIPAGFHGGPRTSIGGPTSLIERWRGGGRCDCGGWDIGCPLTVLKTGPSNKVVLPHADASGESSAFDLFIQGSKQDAPPIIKMVNIHDGLYYIHYRSSLSALQSLSIAVAYIQSHSPTLQPKFYRS